MGGVLYDRFVSANLCIGGIELQEIIGNILLARHKCKELRFNTSSGS